MDDESSVVALMPSSDGVTKYEIVRNSAGILQCACDGYKWRKKCTHIRKYLEGLEVVIKTRIVFSGQSAHIVTGVEVPLSVFKVGDLTDRIRETEEHLSRLTGLTVRIETDTE